MVSKCVARGIVLLVCAMGLGAPHSAGVAPLIALLESGEPVLGVFPGPQTVAGGTAVAQNTATDFVFYSMERGPFDIPAMQEYAAAMRAAGPQRDWPLALRIPPVGEDADGARARTRQWSHARESSSPWRKCDGSGK